jgi:hypothetical protein
MASTAEAQVGPDAPPDEDEDEVDDRRRKEEEGDEELQHAVGRFVQGA